MKKLVTTSIILSMIAAMLTSCGDSSDRDKISSKKSDKKAEETTVSETVKDEPAVETTPAETAKAPETEPVTSADDSADEPEAVTEVITHKAAPKPNSNEGNFNEDKIHLDYVGDEYTGYIKFPEDMKMLNWNEADGGIGDGIVSRQQACIEGKGNELIIGIVAFDKSLITFDSIITNTREACQADKEITKWNEEISSKIGSIPAYLCQAEYKDGVTLYTWVFDKSDGTPVMITFESIEKYKNLASVCQTEYIESKLPADIYPSSDLYDMTEKDFNNDPLTMSDSLLNSENAKVGCPSYGYIDIPKDWSYDEKDANKEFESKDGKRQVLLTKMLPDEGLSAQEFLESLMTDLEERLIDLYPHSISEKGEISIDEGKYKGIQLKNDSEEGTTLIYGFSDEQGIIHVVKVDAEDGIECLSLISTFTMRP